MAWGKKIFGIFYRKTSLKSCGGNFGEVPLIPIREKSMRILAYKSAQALQFPHKTRRYGVQFTISPCNTSLQLIASINLL